MPKISQRGIDMPASPIRIARPRSNRTSVNFPTSTSRHDEMTCRFDAFKCRGFKRTYSSMTSTYPLMMTLSSAEQLANALLPMVPEQ